MHFRSTAKLNSPAVIIMVFFGAAFAALTIFVRAPEEVRMASADGRVEIWGLVPRGFGPFRITKDKQTDPTKPIITPTYLIEPSQILLPRPVRLVFRYELAEINGENPSRLALARWNTGYDRWEPVESFVDQLVNTVSAEVRSLSRWGVLVRRDQLLPPAIKEATDRLLGEPPAGTIGFTVDVEYAERDDNFVLLAPAYRRGGCNGFLEGDQEIVVQETVPSEAFQYRITLVWEQGDTSRCDDLN